MIRRHRHLRAAGRAAGGATALALAGVVIGWTWGGRG